MRTLTITEAAEATGATVKAIRNRCDRGQLRFVLQRGVRRIPLSELQRAGLLEGELGEELEAGERTDGAAVRELVSRELLAELGRAQAELGRVRALTERTETTARELRELARQAEAEAAAERDRRVAAERELAELRRRSLVARVLNR
jgi:VIT1/CCC1 family predicted Fe2+/Mn2+ transporter